MCSLAFLMLSYVFVGFPYVFQGHLSKGPRCSIGFLSVSLSLCVLNSIVVQCFRDSLFSNEITKHISYVFYRCSWIFLNSSNDCSSFRRLSQEILHMCSVVFLSSCYLGFQSLFFVFTKFVAGSPRFSFRFPKEIIQNGLPSFFIGFLSFSSVGLQPFLGFPQGFHRLSQAPGFP